MAPEKNNVKDWQIPFMLFELSSYTQGRAKKNQQQKPNKEQANTINHFFGEGSEQGLMDFIFDNMESMSD